MKLTYVKGDLFTADTSYCLAHCVSADFAQGAGIAREFNRRYDMRNKLFTKYGNYTHKYTGGNCLLVDRVLNLVTKPQYWSKPTYATMRRALTDMKDVCEEHGITKVAMPLIGCGLDRLKWDEVEKSYCLSSKAPT